MSKSICDSSVTVNPVNPSSKPWYSVNYGFNKEDFIFRVNNIIDATYSYKLKELSNVINENTNHDYSVFEHINYILSNVNNDDSNWNKFQTCLECLIILDQIHDVHLSDRLCTPTGDNYNNAKDKGCYNLDNLITLLINKAKSIDITVPPSAKGPDALKTPFIEYLKALPYRKNILHELKPNESSSKIPNGIYVIRDTKSKGKAKEEVLIKTEEKIDTISSLTDSHSCKSNGNFKITKTITSISEIDILNLGLLYYQSYFSYLTYGDYHISIHFDISQVPQQIACSGSFKLCIKLWPRVRQPAEKYLGAKCIEISSNVFSVKNVCETLTKKNTADKIAIELQAFFNEHDLPDAVIGIFIMNILMIGKGYGDYGQGFTAGCAYMYKENVGEYPLYCNCFVETVDTFFFLICVLCLFPAIIGTTGNNWQYVILNDSQRFFNKNVIEMFNANSKIKVEPYQNGDGDSDMISRALISEIKSGKLFEYETQQLSVLEKSEEIRKNSMNISRPSGSGYGLSLPPPTQLHTEEELKFSYMQKLDTLISENDTLNLGNITTTLSNISLDDIIKKGVKLAMAKYFVFKIIRFKKSLNYFLFFKEEDEMVQNHSIYPIFWDGKLLEDIDLNAIYPGTKEGVYESYRERASKVDANTFAFMVIVYVFLNRYNGYHQYTKFINMVGAISFTDNDANKSSGNKASKNYKPASEFSGKEQEQEGPVFDQIKLDKITEFEGKFKSSLRDLTSEIASALKKQMGEFEMGEFEKVFSLQTSAAVQILLSTKHNNILEGENLIKGILKDRGSGITYFQFEIGEKRKSTKGELDVLKTVVCKITSICDNIEEYCNILDRILKNIRDLTDIKVKLQQTINDLSKQRRGLIDEEGDDPDMHIDEEGDDPDMHIDEEGDDPDMPAIYEKKILCLRDFSLRQLGILLRYYNVLFDKYYKDHEIILSKTENFYKYFSLGGWGEGGMEEELNKLVKDINGKVSATNIDCGNCNTKCLLADMSNEGAPSFPPPSLPPPLLLPNLSKKEEDIVEAERRRRRRERER